MYFFKCSSFWGQSWGTLSPDSLPDFRPGPHWGTSVPQTPWFNWPPTPPSRYAHENACHNIIALCMSITLLNCKMSSYPAVSEAKTRIARIRDAATHPRMTHATPAYIHYGPKMMLTLTQWHFMTLWPFSPHNSDRAERAEVKRCINFGGPG